MADFEPDPDQFYVGLPPDDVGEIRMFFRRHIGLVRAAEVALFCAFVGGAWFANGDMFVAIPALAVAWVVAIVSLLASNMSRGAVFICCILVGVFLTGEGFISYWHFHSQNTVQTVTSTIKAKETEEKENESSGIKLIYPPPLNARRNPDGSERAFVRILPEDIISVFKTHMTEQAKALVGQYREKWIAVSGVVYDVTITGQNDVTVVMGYTPLSIVVHGIHQMHFDPRAPGNKSIGLLARGNNLKAVCRIDDIQQSGIAFSRCEEIE